MSHSLSHRIQLAITVAMLFCVVTTRGCTGVNPEYCNKNSDCTNGDDCNLATNTCVQPVGCSSSRPCTSETAPHCKINQNETSGECVACLAPEHCPGEQTCEPSTNTCVGQLCSPGEEGDAICVEVDPSTPYCDDTGYCNECLERQHCDGELYPVCDGGVCRGCEDHEECESGFCLEETGACAHPASIVYVSPRGSTDASCGSADTPCRTISLGLQKVTGDRHLVLLAEGSYTDTLTFGGIGPHLRAQGAVAIGSNIDSGGVAVSVQGGSDVTLEGISLERNRAVTSTTGIGCQDSHLSLIDSTIGKSGGGFTTGLALTNCTVDLVGSTVQHNSTTGIDANNTILRMQQSVIQNSGVVGLDASSGTIEIRRSAIQNNLGGGMHIVEPSMFVLENSFVVRNGTGGDQGSAWGGMWISGPAIDVATVAHSTFSDNKLDNQATGGSALTCSSFPLAATGNIVVLGTGTGGAGVIGGACTFDYSLVQGLSKEPGVGNIIGTPLFVDPQRGNYHLLPGSPGIDVADANSTITVDFDGDPRPRGEGFDMGADEVE